MQPPKQKSLQLLQKLLLLLQGMPSCGLVCVYVQHRHKQGKAGKSTPLAQAGSAQKRELMAAATRTYLVRLLCSSKGLHVQQ